MPDRKQGKRLVHRPHALPREPEGTEGRDLESTHRLNRNEARKRIAESLHHGSVTYSTHCVVELKQDGLTIVDAVNVLRSGRIMEEPEFTNGSFRYRVHTQRLC